MTWSLLIDVGLLVCMQEPLGFFPSFDHVRDYDPHRFAQHEYVPLNQRGVRVGGCHLTGEKVTSCAIDLVKHIHLGQARKVLGTVGK